jgi:hypothetical protein
MVQDSRDRFVVPLTHSDVSAACANSEYIARNPEIILSKLFGRLIRLTADSDKIKEKLKHFY